MNKLARILLIARHPHELRLSLSALSANLAGGDALGSLTDDETAALVRWTNDTGADTFVEIGTLFGFTASAIAHGTRAKVTAVDNFCWNPFGLTSKQHESFTRRVVAGNGVEIIKNDAVVFLGELSKRFNVAKTLVFLDGSHEYADVKQEIEICLEQGIRMIAGHDFGNDSFGVTQAVRDTLGEPDEVCGMCWIKKNGG